MSVNRYLLLWKFSHLRSRHAIDACLSSPSRRAAWPQPAGSGRESTSWRPPAKELEQHLSIHRQPLPRLHDQNWALAPLCIRPSNDRRDTYRGVATYNIFDFRRVDPLAARFDQVL